MAANEDNDDELNPSLERKLEVANNILDMPVEMSDEARKTFYLDAGIAEDECPDIINYLSSDYNGREYFKDEKPTHIPTVKDILLVEAATIYAKNMPGDMHRPDPNDPIPTCREYQSALEQVTANIAHEIEEARSNPSDDKAQEQARDLLEFLKELNKTHDTLPLLLDMLDDISLNKRPTPEQLRGVVAFMDERLEEVIGSIVDERLKFRKSPEGLLSKKFTENPVNAILNLLLLTAARDPDNFAAVAKEGMDQLREKGKPLHGLPEEARDAIIAEAAKSAHDMEHWEDLSPYLVGLTKQLVTRHLDIETKEDRDLAVKKHKDDVQDLALYLGATRFARNAAEALCTNFDVKLHTRGKG